MSPVPPERLLDLARRALAEHPAGLVSDLDGTLSPIVVEPRLAQPAPGALDALGRLAQRLAVVAVVSGRAASDIRRMLGGVRSIWVIGNHGLEWLAPGAPGPEPFPGEAALRVRVEQSLERLGPIDGTTVEHKGLSATIHYRSARDPSAARAAILASMADLGSELETREGRRSVEIRPRGFGDKGTALRGIVERFGLRGLLVAGDDVTDLDMFSAARDLRQAGLRSAAIAVSGGDEVPPSMAAAADGTLADPAALVDLLRALADELPRP